jgi:hypothetical protein
VVKIGDRVHADVALRASSGGRCIQLAGFRKGQRPWRLSRVGHAGGWVLRWTSSSWTGRRVGRASTFLRESVTHNGEGDLRERIAADIRTVTDADPLINDRLIMRRTRLFL